MKTIFKTIATAAILAFTTPAFAGGVVVAEDGESKLKLEALFYLNTYAQKADTTTAAGTVSTKTTGLAVDRAYFTAKYYFNNDWMMRLTTDMGQEPGLGKDQNIYLKYAYVEGKLIGKAAVLRLGQSHTPWIDYEQGLWGHRYVAKTMIDQYKFDDSSDLGAGLKGELADGMVNYFVTATNGSGYGTGTRTNGIDFNSRLGFEPVDGLTLDFQYRTGTRGTKTSVAGVDVAGVKSTLTQIMATYGIGKEFRVGANYISNKDKADSATASTTHGGNVSSGFATAVIGDEVKSTGYSLWAWGKFGDNMGAFARYEDMKNQLTGVATDEKLTRYLAGVEYSPIKNVTFALVADQSKLTNRGGVAANGRKDTRYGLYSKIKL
ncbi:MAG: hypothetical protein RQ867_05650 [Mariprofundaceae bacterium]|nr:hypothetical protein [Mariprofundaceae bacterium]